MKKIQLQPDSNLIEIAIVVAVLMALTSIIYPVYSNYVKSAKVTKGIALATAAKTALVYSTINNVPLASVWTPPAPTDAVANMSIYITETTGISVSSHGELLTNLPARHSGEIVITFSPEIAPVGHNELILSPRQTDPNQQASNGHELPLGSPLASKTQSITWECNSAIPPLVNRGSHGTLDAKLTPAECRA